jgi:hypothetical protein
MDVWCLACGCLHQKPSHCPKLSRPEDERG